MLWGRFSQRVVPQHTTLIPAELYKGVHEEIRKDMEHFLDCFNKQIPMTHTVFSDTSYADRISLATTFAKYPTQPHTYLIYKGDIGNNSTIEVMADVRYKQYFIEIVDGTGRYPYCAPFDWPRVKRYIGDFLRSSEA